MPNLTPDLVEQATRADPDRALATTFLPASVRERVLTLILFNHEVARARSAVSEAGLAAIRLQWWRDTLDQIYDKKTVRAQPIAMALAQLIDDVPLPKSLFDALIDGYEAQLEATPFANWAAIDAYLNATQGNLNRLCLLAAGKGVLTTHTDVAAGQAGLASGYAALLRDTPKWLARRSMPLPIEELGGADQEILFAGEVTPQLAMVLQRLVARIKPAQTKCNQALKSAALSDTFPVLASACFAHDYAIRYLPKVGPNWEQRGEPSLFWRQIKLVACVARGRV